MIAIAGGVLALLGLLAGALLVAAPLGLVGAVPGVSLWILFPLLTLIGYFLLVASDVDLQRGTSTKVVAIPLLLIALLAAVALVAVGAGIASANGLAGTAPLWYVMIVGGVLGAIGTGATSGKPGSSQAS